MRKILSFSFLVIMAFGAFMLVSCQKPATDVLKIALDIEDEGRYDELFQYFTTETGISVQATYGEDISKLIGTVNEPDIIKTSTVVIESMQDSLYDLTDMIASDPDVDPLLYIDSLIEALTIDGRIYALPTSINTSLLYYNKDLFDENADSLRIALGLGPDDSVYPEAGWTYADYQTAGVVLSKYTVLPDQSRVYSQFGAETQLNWWGEWLVYLNQMGGTFYEPGTDNHVLAITSPEAVQATQFFREKSMGDTTEKFAPDAVEAASSFSFMSGNVAMIFGGHMGDWYSYDALGMNWDIQILPTPVGIPDARGGEISADAFGISIRSQNKTDAFKFLKMWAGETGALKMYEYGKVGALKNMEQLILALPEADRKAINIQAVFQAADLALTLPREKDFSKVMREMVMAEIYKLMFNGRGAETDCLTVLTRIKTNVDQYYANLYD